MGGCLEKIRRMLQGDEYIGRGSSQRRLGRSPCAIPTRSRLWKETGNTEFRRSDPHRSEASGTLASSLWETPRMPLPAHAGVSRRQYYCRIQAAVPGGLRQGRYEGRSPIFSSSEQTCTTSFRAGLRRWVHTGRGSGWTGWDGPLLVGSSFPPREICDGQSLASPGRWAVNDRRHPEDSIWSEVVKRYMTPRWLLGRSRKKWTH